MRTLLTAIKKASFADIRASLTFIALIPFGLLLRQRCSDIWLVSERPKEARDNAYWFFRHLHENDLHRACYYVIDRGTDDWERVRAVARDRVIPHGTLKHYLYYVAAHVHISAHIGGGMPNAWVASHLERWNFLQNQKVFLGHGVTKDTLDWAFRTNARIDLFCCAAEREAQHVLDVFGYRNHQVAVTGLCRYDQLLDNTSTVQDRYILVMPTWRTYLAEVDEEEFCRSTYYQTYVSMLSNPQLHDTLKSNRCRLFFHLHPGMQRFNHLFIPVLDLIEVTDGRSDIQALLKGASLLITDYSSVFFDFAYMSKPVAYYQFDYTEFRAGHWATGYFDYETDGFGPVVRSEPELINTVQQVIQRGCVPDAEYLARSRQFFAFHDANNCARTFAAVASLVVSTKQS